MARKPNPQELFDALTEQMVKITTSQQTHLQLLTTNMQALAARVDVLTEQAIKQHENIVSLSDQLDALKQPETN